MQNPTLAKLLAALTVLILLLVIALHFLNPSPPNNTSGSVTPTNHFKPPPFAFHPHKTPAPEEPSELGDVGRQKSRAKKSRNGWLDNLALAFPREPLPILDAGLASLTVGVVPPTLDEVLIGAIDRARNPTLKLALMLGVNESIFPAAPVILTFSDRDELEKQNIALCLNPFEQVSRERYLSYNAYTRANEKLALKFSRQTADGKTLNPSPFAAQLRRIFPHLEIEEVSTEQN